jgi:putative salt-induced outer membrane protein YdiY
MTFPAISLALAAAAAAPTVSTPAEPVLQPLAPPAVSAQDDAAAKDPAWQGAFTVGVSLTDGNTDITKASATADAVKELDGSRYTLGFSWNFSEEDGIISQRKTFGRAQYDRFLSDKMYWLAQTSAEADSQAGVDLRTTIGGGIGYQLKDTDTFKLGGEAGLSWFNEELDPNVKNDYIAARLAYNWTYKLSDKWVFEQNGDIFPSLEDAADIYSKIDTRVKATLTESMFAQLQWVWDWDNTPATGRKRSDNLYLLTIGWKF